MRIIIKGDDRVKIKAHAKVNLGLNVVSRREDGYHELEMIMAPIALHDLIYINAIDSGIELSSNSYNMPTDERNIMYKAAKLMIDTFGIKKGVKIHVYKHIPIQAGLAGGSADGAAVIKAMNKIFRLNQTNEQLAEIGKQIGADIPFCIHQKTAFVSGIGEKIEYINANIDCFLVLVKPRKGVSTKRAFESLELEKEIHPDCHKLRKIIEVGDYQEMVGNLGNTLERVSMNLVPQINEIKSELIEMGFDCALMSGSGSCVFALTKNEELASEAVSKFRERRIFAQKSTFI